MPKVGISVTTTKFDKKLAYWPLAAPLFILFFHFLFAKPMKITLTIRKKSFKDFSNRKNAYKRKIGYYEISETFFLFEKSLKLVSTNC